ncbi:MAG TPA: hypothetical protein VGH38_35225 [Bryobacteraceae bacterium]
MKRNGLTPILMMAVLATPAAFGMHYATAQNPLPISTLPVNLPHLLPLNISACSSDSNTVAVGYETYAGGFRLLCADAARIGFWTTTLPAELIGQQAGSTQRFLCPSGTALAGAQYIEGLIYPMPLCGELIPDLTSGDVRHTVLFTVDETVVEKLSKNGPTTPGVVSCGPAGWVQSLIASRNASNQVNGFGVQCNTIVTAPANLEDVNVDLAVRTVNQKPVLGRNASEQFRVDVFNLGTAAIQSSNVSIELRFDGSAWQLQPFAEATCTDLLAHKGVVDRLFVGKRCIITGDILGGRGNVISATFLLEPFGPDTTRPATTVAQPIVSVTVSQIDDRLEGADPNTANDLAAFPVILR